MLTRFRLLTLLLVLMIFISGCGSNNSASSDSTDSTQPQSEENTAITDQAKTVINAGSFTLSYDFSMGDTDSTWDKNSATMIVFNNDTVQISGAGASFSSGVLTIKQAGTYVMSGSLKNGQILIDAGKNDIIRLVLNGVSLHNETGPSINALKSEKTILILEKGSQNKISDGSEYKDSGNGDPDAAIYSKNDLSITGDGTLTVTGNYKHGIRTQDILAITGGVINVKAAGDALRGRDGVAVQNGILTLVSSSDGIQSNNDTDDAKGFVIITGGTFNIQSGNDGIQAKSSLTVTGGNFQINTGGGSANAPERVKNRPGGGGGWGGGRGRPGSEPQPLEYPTEEKAENGTESMKALKAGKLVYITGGDFIIDAEDDAVHSNENVIVTSGKFTVQTGDDGFHADSAVEISGGEINILTCYEGIEGLTVTISGGDITIVAKDDAINAAGASDIRMQANESAFILISGGTIDLYTTYDGIDSNGNIYIEGGSLKISASSMGADGAIECDGSMLITGGEIITAGSVTNYSQNITQPLVLVSYNTGDLDSGSVITIKDASGDVLLEYTSKIECSLSGFTSTAFKIGETYSLFINDEKRIDIKLESNITSIGDDGGAYTGNERGGPGGGMGGRQPPRQ